MKVAVLADIHANIAALTRVLSDIRAEGIDQLVILGDVVGYYYEPAAVIEALQPFQCTAIQGNHDRMALTARKDWATLTHYRDRYGSGLDAVLEQFADAHWAWLEALPVSCEITLADHRIHLAHGAPFDPDAYIYPNDSEERLARVGEGLECDQVWLGHTHWPFLRSGSPTILNPGSVGQPRDIGGLASWAIFYPETGAIALRRTEFSVEAAQAECRVRDSGREQLGAVLTRNRLQVPA